MIKSFIQHISEGNNDAMDASLKTLIMTRVNTALDIKRIELASTVYNEAYETPSIVDIIDHKAPKDGAELESLFHELDRSDQLDPTEYKKLWNIFNDRKADWAEAKRYLIILIGNYADVPKTVKLLNGIAKAASIKGIRES